MKKPSPGKQGSHGKPASLEKPVQTQAMKELSADPDNLIWRNNVGVAFFRDGPQMRPVKFGLCPGSSDLIGLRSVTVTPDMVGKKVAVFMAVECKSDNGRLRDEQKRFLGAVKEKGGIAKVVKPGGGSGGEYKDF